MNNNNDRSYKKRDYKGESKRRRPECFDDRLESDEASDWDEGYIVGRNAVTEALKAGHPINKIFVTKGDSDSSLRHIISMAKDAGIVVTEADKRKLDFMSANGAHQGVIAVAAVKEYCSVADILNIAKERGEAPFIIICDEVSDAHNLGAIIRTAESAGAHGVIIPKRRSAGLSAIISKTSAGAVEYMAVARVANLNDAIKELKDNGVWIYGTAADGSSELWNTDLTGAIALVIGSEGEGMRRLVSENCDFHVSIPMRGKVSSLNASASAAIVIYEAVRQRSVKK
jgi:23S rRNA (guanosine2251-2'-O)-methyltransferase